ncbi:unnamed protein product [Lactuca saligna]|uniref:Uncharacterized protein n=1 Tax=Lactuca saligna TaxID=75948 RepID=A0AA36A3K2_LACSI|nr:unnamed protein product [Lactuca saligna]
MSLKSVTTTLRLGFMSGGVARGWIACTNNWYQSLGFVKRNKARLRVGFTKRVALCSSADAVGTRVSGDEVKASCGSKVNRGHEVVSVRHWLMAQKLVHLVGFFDGCLLFCGVRQGGAYSDGKSKFLCFLDRWKKALVSQEVLGENGFCVVNNNSRV